MHYLYVDGMRSDVIDLHLVQPEQRNIANQVLQNHRGIKSIVLLTIVLFSHAHLSYLHKLFIIIILSTKKFTSTWIQYKIRK